MNSSVCWIDSASWELDFFGLPHRIPWPAELDPAVANRAPFETEHLLQAIELLGAEAIEPWQSFGRAGAYFEDLAEALEDGEIVRARELLEEIERLHPGTSFVLFHQAYIARSEGRNDAAIALYQQAAQKAPAVPEIWNNLGVVLAMAARRDEAITAFRKALQCAPNDRVALEGLAQLRVLVKLLRKADDPESALFVDIPTFRRMTSEQIPALAQQPDQLVAFGEQLLQDGIVPDVGVLALEKAHALQPQHPRTLLTLTAAYRRSGAYEKARQTVTRYTELYPADALGFLQLAQLCNAVGDATGERAALERTLEIDPNAQQALAAKFGLSPAEHDPAKEQELADFGAARGSWMAFVLASAVAGTRGDAKGAVKWAQRAVALNPDGEEALLQHTSALGQARDMAGLARFVKPEVESGKFSKRVDWNYAQVLRHLGLNNDAVSVLRKAASGDVSGDFKASCATAIDAWSGLLTGTGVPLEVHPSGVLLRPVLLALEEGDGGVILNAGAALPAEGEFSWRSRAPHTEVLLQQGQTGSAREPQSLGIFKVSGIQPAADHTATIECRVTALRDGALHFRAAHNGRRLPVAWAPPPTALR